MNYEGIFAIIIQVQKVTEASAVRKATSVLSVSSPVYYSIAALTKCLVVCSSC